MWVEWCMRLVLRLWWMIFQFPVTSSKGIQQRWVVTLTIDYVTPTVNVWYYQSPVPVWGTLFTCTEPMGSKAFSPFYVRVVFDGGFAGRIRWRVLFHWAQYDDHRCKWHVPEVCFVTLNKWLSTQQHAYNLTHSAVILNYNLISSISSSSSSISAAAPPFSTIDGAGSIAFSPFWIWVVFEGQFYLSKYSTLFYLAAWGPGFSRVPRGGNIIEIMHHCYPKPSQWKHCYY